MARMLSIVRINGRLYFRDDRLEEFRAVNDPHDRITFNEMIAVVAAIENVKYLVRNHKHYAKWKALADLLPDKIVEEICHGGEICK